MLDHEPLDLPKRARRDTRLVRDRDRVDPEFGLTAERTGHVNVSTLTTVRRVEVEAVGADAKDRGHPID